MFGQERKYTIPYHLLNEDSDRIIGLQGEMVRKILAQNIFVPAGFVLTTDAFDDFLVANDLVAPISEKLSQINSGDMKNIQKISSEIELLFKESVTQSSIFDSIRQSYDMLAHSKEVAIRVYPSWIDQASKYSGNTDSKYSFTNIYAFDQLEKIIIKTWQALFDPNAIFERYENKYSGPLSIAVNIQKIPNVEISGRAYSYNPLTKNDGEVEIEAVFGMYRGVEELELNPDRYVVSKNAERIVEKNTTGQKKMLLHRGNVKTGEPPEIQIEISEHWQMRQKISDEVIQNIAIITKAIEKQIEKQVDIEWGIEAGKIYVCSVKPAKNIARMNYGSIDIIDRTGVGPGFKPVHASTTNSNEEKSIDAYVEEIQNSVVMEPNDTKTSVVDTAIKTEDENSPNFEKLATEILDTQSESNHNVQNFEQASKLHEATITKKHPRKVKRGIYKNFEFAQKTKLEENVIDIWIDANGDKSVHEINSHEFKGIYGVNGEHLLESFGKINDDKDLKEFGEYMAEEIFELASRDLSKFMIYTISTLDEKQAHDLLESPTHSIDMHMADDRLLNVELEAIRKIRTKFGFRKLWLNIRDIGQINDLTTLKKIISSSGLKHFSTFKIFIEVSKMPVFLNIDDYAEEGIDGVIVDLDFVIHNLLGTKVSAKKILKNDVFVNMLKKFSTRLHKSNIQFIVKTKTFEADEEFLLALMKFGMTGIITSPRGFISLKDRINRLELEILEKI